MKIPLTQGKFAIVGPKDYAFLMQWKWCYDNGYAARTDRTGSKQRSIYMHRVILGRMGFEDFVRSDHIDRNPLDNRRCNLRPATSSQNGYNRDRHKNNTSGYTGVCWARRKGKWRAQIRVNKKLKHLGYYDDLKEAARVYDKAALKYHGDFATLNEV